MKGYSWRLKWLIKKDNLYFKYGEHLPRQEADIFADSETRESQWATDTPNITATMKQRHSQDPPEFQLGEAGSSLVRRPSNPQCGPPAPSR